MPKLDLLFKGYCYSNGKAPVEKIKNRNRYKSLEELDTDRDYVGILKDNVIQIDIDDKEKSDIVWNIINDKHIECFVLETTRGKHFYFINSIGYKSPAVAKNIALNIEADIGVGCKSRAVPLKKDGKLRKWLKTTDELQPLPVWLYPTNSTKINLYQKHEHDGRNEEVYRYIMFLMYQTIFQKQDIIEIINVINNYILADALEESELKVLLRDDVLNMQLDVFYEGHTFLFDKFAAYLTNNYSIVMIDDRLHVYKDGIYVADDEELERIMIKHISLLNDSKRKEVYKYLRLICKKEVVAEPKYIAVKNGILNMVTKEITPFTPNIILTTKINIDYNPSASFPLMDETFEKLACGDMELVDTLYEIFGYCLFRYNFIHKAFFLTGEGSNGKSTYMDILQNFLGHKNYCSIELKELQEDRFKLAEFHNKLANVVDDCSGKFIEDSSMFKKLVGGNVVNAQKKGKDPFEYKNYSKQIFSFNDAPVINDTSYGLTRRILMVPFNAKFTETDSDYDPLISFKLKSKESMEYLLYKAVEYANKILKTKKLTISKSSLDANRQYIMYNNGVMQFVYEPLKSGKVRIDKYEDPKDLEIKSVYNDYVIYCLDSGVKALGKKRFEKEMTRLGFVIKLYNGIQYYDKGGIQ